METSGRSVLPVILIALMGFCRPSAAADSARPNVLFIAVDDLRPDLGCYGEEGIRSPQIDKLAAGGMTFLRAYCQQAVCSPSRTSLLLGRRPDTTRIYDLNTHFRKYLPNVITLPEHFKRNGYHTQAFSKIYHGGLDDPQSWSVPHWAPGGPSYIDPAIRARLDKRRAQLRAEGKREGRPAVEKDAQTGLILRRAGRRYRVTGPPWEAPDVTDNALADGKTADRAIEVMRQLEHQPFFLAVGFLKPHLPFIAPKRYFDLYPLDTITPAANPYPPEDVPQIALTTWGELRSYEGMPKRGPLDDRQARELIRGYRAATSYVDTQIGRLLDELDRLKLADNTVVVLWGDHGWQLGEHGLWCKHTNFELATRSLLILRAPGRKVAGGTTSALVEFVDVYPTLVELCGLPMPAGLEGTSMVPLFDNPGRSWKKAAFSQYPRGNVMGYSMRTDRCRYTEWLEKPATGKSAGGGSGAGVPPEGTVVARELYDHKADPDENINLAERPESGPLIADLSKRLHAGWKAALPD